MPRRRLFSTVAVSAIFYPSRASGQQTACITAKRHLGDAVARASPYSPSGAKNPYTTLGSRTYAQDGQSLGRVNTYPHDPESVANPCGRYGSGNAPNSINTFFGRFGSEHSSLSASDPNSTTPPVVIYGQPADVQHRTPTVLTVPRNCRQSVEPCD